MVKNLYLLRHGQAEYGFQGSDFDRSLTVNGVIQLRSLGQAMKLKSFYPDKVYCSTANRTQQTAEIFTEELDYTLPVHYMEEIYEASVRTLFELITKQDEADSVILIIGHNPGISYLYDYLTSANFGDMTPGELVRIEFEDLAWSEISKGVGFKKTI
ncbi:histidine phosphatase family protein [Marinoscillum sp. 108]|jgi:phosphohistidine phosphatase|uniref:SixA phosphatase family protein n=1 Tax=Marinoscillum luteum TaxID=861051 RepID=A0ABW7NBC8_9BACT|nr:histidine phosphatase family protein [Marinoscillum sp. 108]VXD16267.1 Phosphohistidine phosphatase [Marinoscillum sp. 108]